MSRVGCAALMLVVLAACGDDGDSDAQGRGPQEPTTSATELTGAESGTGTTAVETTTGSPSDGSGSPQAEPGTVVTTGDSEFGEMLFDARDQAIYLFEPEAEGAPACYGECEAAWPPVLTDGAPRADGDTDPDLLGTVQRRDGSRQVTYNGWPLYFYAHEGPGEVLCHDVFLNGGLWLAVGPDGEPLPT
ncbi:MAG: COG4315 family predicted lipoprotein [Nocardioidaceae bacterium]